MKTLPWLALLLLPGISSFARADGTPGPEAWVQDGKILAPDGSTKDRFGTAVAISGDTLLIGVPHDGDSGPDSGSAYVYVRSASGWGFQAKLGASVVAAGDEFGHSVAIYGDTAIVGAPGDDVAGTSSGSAHVYVRSGSTWAHQAQLSPSQPTNGAEFGSSVSIESDTAVVGAGREHTTAFWAGATYVFVRAGTQWHQEARLVASDPAEYAAFGSSVSISGGRALVGAPSVAGYSPPPGAAYVFERSGSSWTQRARIQASDGTGADRFGYSLSLSGDTALLGAYGTDEMCPSNTNCNSGSAYVFQWSGSEWRQQAKLLASDSAKGDYFGSSVSLSGDTALIGAMHTDDAGMSYSGSAYAYTRSGQLWSQDEKILAIDLATNDFFGTAVALEGKCAIIGSPRDGGATDRGSAYIYRRSGPPGELYCFGDPGSGTPCPCNNDNDGSVPGSGCASGAHASGAQLTGNGVASVTSDSLVLACASQEPFNSGLYFQGNNNTSPGLLWGDGLQCAGGFLVRLQVRQADVRGDSSTTIGIASKVGNVTAGAVKYYQCWYRNPASSPCGSQFNASNGYAVSWIP